MLLVEMPLLTLGEVDRHVSRVKDLSKIGINYSISHASVRHDPKKGRYVHEFGVYSGTDLAARVRLASVYRNHLDPNARFGYHSHLVNQGHPELATALSELKQKLKAP